MMQFIYKILPLMKNFWSFVKKRVMNHQNVLDLQKYSFFIE